MNKKYTHLFFDLDHTLWDFERNAEEAKHDLFTSLKLQEKGIPSYEAFREKYVKINKGLWELYREDKIEKKELNFKRFYLALCEFGMDDPDLGSKMAHRFLYQIAETTYLFDYANEILEYLYPKYKLYIITNGFDEVQFPKLRKSGLDRFFTRVITSEEAGSKKPDKGIFEFGLQMVNATVRDSIMIGDDLEVDIKGAQSIGMDQVFVNHNHIMHTEMPTFEVENLKGLEAIF